MKDVLTRTGVNGGSLVSPDLMKKLISKLNLVDLSIIYGMSQSLLPHLIVCQHSQRPS